MMTFSYCCRTRQLTVRKEKIGAILPVQLAGAKIGSALADSVGHVRHRQTKRGELIHLDLDPNGGSGAVDLNLTYPINDRDLLTQLGISVIVKIPFRHRIAHQCDIVDRLIVRIRLLKGGRLGQIGRQEALCP